MWGPWAIGMATANTINRFEHVGLRMFDPKAGLTVLEAALGVKRAELVVASFNWKQMIQHLHSQKGNIWRTMFSRGPSTNPNTR